MAMYQSVSMLVRRPDSPMPERSRKALHRETTGGGGGGGTDSGKRLIPAENARLHAESASGEIPLSWRALW